MEESQRDLLEAVRQAAAGEKDPTPQEIADRCEEVRRNRGKYSHNSVKLAKCEWCKDPATHRLIEDDGGELLCARHAILARINGLPTIETGLRRKRVKVRRPVPPSEPPPQT